MLALSFLGILSGIAGVVLSIRSGENLKQIKENVNITRENVKISRKLLSRDIGNLALLVKNKFKEETKQLIERVAPEERAMVSTMIASISTDVGNAVSDHVFGFSGVAGTVEDTQYHYMQNNPLKQNGEWGPGKSC